MKNQFVQQFRTVFLVCSFLYGFTVKAQLSANAERAPLEHLLEINEQWKHHKDALPGNQSIQFTNDLDRIQYHLDLVISELSTNPPNSFGSNQIDKRNALLGELQEYSNRKVFPTNIYHSERTPYFIDDYGVHCAVGYLIKISGHEELALQISKEHNYEYIADIKTEGIAEWTNEFGFTIDELKWIQPGYSDNVIINSIFKVDDGKVRGSIVDDKSNLIITYGSFKSIDSKSYTGIVVTKNNTQSVLSEDIKGDIYDVHGTIDDLLFCGDIKTLSMSMAFGHLKNGNWTGLSSPNPNLPYARKIFRINDNEAFVVLSETDSIASKSELWIWNLKDNSTTKKCDFIGLVSQFANTSDGILIGGSFLSGNFYSESDTIPSNEAIVLKYSNNQLTEHVRFVESVYEEVNAILTSDSGCYLGFKADYINDTKRSMCLVGFANSNSNKIRSIVDRSDLLWEGTDSREHGAFRANSLSLYNNTQLMVGGIFRMSKGFASASNLIRVLVDHDNAISPTSGPGEIFSLDYLSDSLLYVTHTKGLSQFNHPVSVPKNQTQPTISVYPNPFTTTVTVDGLSQQDFTYDLVDLSGQIIQTGTSESSIIHIDETLKQGVYTLTIHTKDGLITQKLIKE